MLSYRHAYHAGNFADVHKHVVLSLLVQSLLHKDSPFCYVDSHAGAGRYDLHASEAQKNAEHQQGIQRLCQQNEVPEAVRPYLAAVQAVNRPENKAAPRYYPGSPYIVRYFLRPQDRMVLTELHPTDFQLLQQEFANDRQVAVHHLDGYQGLKAFLPPQERRGLVLIDPAFERRDETAHMVAGAQIAHKRWAHGLFVMWLPITNRAAAADFYQRLEKIGLRKILVTEICIRPPVTARQLNGSAMIIINPPWQLDKTLREVLPWLGRVLAIHGEEGSHRVEWLVAE